MTQRLFVRSVFVCLALAIFPGCDDADDGASSSAEGATLGDSGDTNGDTDGNDTGGADVCEQPTDGSLYSSCVGDQDCTGEDEVCITWWEAPHPAASVCTRLCDEDEQCSDLPLCSSDVDCRSHTVAGMDSIRYCALSCTENFECPEGMKCTGWIGDGICVGAEGTLPTCGDGEKNQQSEQCDGDDLDSMECTDFGFGGGTVSCDAECLFDVSGCTG